MDSGSIIGLIFFLITCLLVIGPILFLFIVMLLIFLLVVPRKTQEAVRMIREAESSITYEGKAKIIFRNSNLQAYPRFGQKMQVYFLPNQVFCVNYVELLSQYRLYTVLLQLIFEPHVEKRNPLVLPHKIQSVVINDHNMVITFRGTITAYLLTCDLILQGIVNHSDFNRIISLIPEKFVEM